MRTRPVAKVEGHILRSVPQPSASLLAREALARAGFGQRPCRLESEIVHPGTAISSLFRLPLRLLGRARDVVGDLWLDLRVKVGRGMEAERLDRLLDRNVAALDRVAAAVSASRSARCASSFFPRRRRMRGGAGRAQAAELKEARRHRASAARVT